MITTSYGYRNPETGDKSKGTTGWMTALGFNITRFDAHNHDGTSSALLNSYSIAPLTTSLVAGGWVVSGAGYKQTVTSAIPAGITDVANHDVSFSNTATGAALYLGWIRNSALSFDVFCNDNTIGVTILYR